MEGCGAAALQARRTTARRSRLCSKAAAIAALRLAGVRLTRSQVAAEIHGLVGADGWREKKCSCCRRPTQLTTSACMASGPLLAEARTPCLASRRAWRKAAVARSSARSPRSSFREGSGLGPNGASMPSSLHQTILWSSRSHSLIESGSTPATRMPLRAAAATQMWSQHLGWPSRPNHVGSVTPTLAAASTSPRASRTSMAKNAFAVGPLSMSSSLASMKTSSLFGCLARLASPSKAF